jgi:hypothetical protein
MISAGSKNRALPALRRFVTVWGLARKVIDTIVYFERYSAVLDPVHKLPGRA